MRSSNIGTATLIRTNLSERAIYGNFAGKDLTGIIMAKSTFIDANFTGANLTGADLRYTWAEGFYKGWDFFSPNFTGANLTGADLTGANLIRANLAQVNWRDATCPSGSKSGSGGCSAFPTEPPADFNSKKFMWYQAERRLVESDRRTYDLVRMQGTVGAPISNVIPGTGKDTYSFDGVQGTITNATNQRLVVKVIFTSSPYTFDYDQRAILEPGTTMSYQLASQRVPGQTDVLEFWPAGPYGQTVKDPAKLSLYDPNYGYPYTEFAPPYGEFDNERSYKEQESHYEIWGSTKILVKREIDGWRIPVSDDFKSLYGDPNNERTEDWAIFTIRIEGL